MAEALKRRTPGKAEERRKEQPDNHQPTKLNQGSRFKKHFPAGGAAATPPTEPPSVSDMVIEDLTPTLSRSERFEEQLREIDQAINAVDIFKGENNESLKRQTQSKGLQDFNPISATHRPHIKAHNREIRLK